MSKEDKKGVWIATYECNQYDQYGEYFLAVFSEKPTVAEFAPFVSQQVCLSDDMGDAIRLVSHYLDGKGRTKAMEDTWVNMNFVEFGDKS